MTLSIRPAGPADLPDVGHLHHRSRAAAYADLIPADDLNAVPAGAMAQWWGERWTYERDTHRLNVAADGDGIVGFSYAGPSETPEAVELYAIHVDPARVGSGVGLALMAAAHRDLAALAAPGMRAVLWVLTGNTRARRFYDRDGWRADGETRRSAIGTTLTPQLRYTRTVD
ncbi:MAG TPA: GNAT family N-acetyltransferase [Catenuloplanes sp.]